MFAKNRLAAVLGGSLVFASAGLALADSDLDNRLEDKIEERLKAESNTNLDKLSVDVKDGTATLTGEVSSAAERARAERLAKASGAKRVVNEVTVDVDKQVAKVEQSAEAKKDRIDERASRQKAAVDRQTEATKNRLENGGSATVAEQKAAPVEHTNDSKKGSLADPLVTAKVKTKIMADDSLDKSEINVDTDKDGIVTLKGYVPNSVAKARAIEIARTTDGVKKVVDRLDVKAPVVK